MDRSVHPTERELDILKILWRRREATVREVHQQMRTDSPIVQNTVQAFLRTMEDKGLVDHRLDGRTFVYRPTCEREQTSQRMLGRLLDRVYDGAVDRLVDSLLSVRRPSAEELEQLDTLIARARSSVRRQDPREGLCDGAND